MTIVELIQQARADADRYNEAAAGKSLEDFIAASDDAASDSFADTGFTTAFHNTIYSYAFAARLLSHIEDRQALTDPRPKTLGDLVTPKQLWFIRNLGREIGCNVEQECQGLLNCPLEDISKKAASALIDYLKRKAAEGADAGDLAAPVAGVPF